MTVSHSLPRHLQKTAYADKRDRSKRLLDLLASSILLIPAIPLTILLAIIVRASSPGPGIFRQTRVGKNGKLFTMYKIRTMRIDAESNGIGAAWAQNNDYRSTPIGNWLRKSHLDELPQLFNVIAGEMSLVGPRPERPEFVQVLSKRIPNYNRRLEVLPGITGLAQLNLPPDHSLDDVWAKTRLDLIYIETHNLGLDLRLLLATAGNFILSFRQRSSFPWKTQPIPYGDLDNLGNQPSKPDHNAGLPTKASALNLPIIQQANNE